MLLELQRSRQSGGIIASPGPIFAGFRSLALPVTLGAPQTWSVDGVTDAVSAPFLAEGDVIGPADSFGVKLNNDADLDLAANIEVGAFSIVGDDPADTGRRRVDGGSTIRSSAAPGT